MRVCRRKNLTLGQTMIFLSLFVLIGVLVLGFQAIPQYLKANALIQSSLPVEAQVTSVYKHSKGAGLDANYWYRVGGVTFRGRSGYVGDLSYRGAIQVNYLPSDPSYSAIFPAANARSAKTGLVFVSIFNLVFLSIIIGSVVRVRLGLCRWSDR